MALLPYILKCNSLTHSPSYYYLPSPLHECLFIFFFQVIIQWRGWRVRRERECEVLRVYWLFLLLNVFLVSTIAGLLANQYYIILYLPYV
jgi:4-amino-4-deoxy-L-arabinose transferase-like glycosyltransferase